MKKLLRIDCSSRIEGSYSRQLADFFEARWLDTNPEGIVIHRDLAEDPMPHISDSTIEGFHTPVELMTEPLQKATELSDELIAELKATDELLISSPLYNANVPSNLKAYIDQIVRVNHTIKIDQDGYHGLLTHIKAHLITSKGGVIKGTPYEPFEFQDPFLKTIMNLLGIEMMNLYQLEGTAHEELVNTNVNDIEEEIINYFN